jgi:hypothetical protein
MNFIDGIRELIIVLALLSVFWVLVIFGVNRAPMWLIYASYPLMALGGGAAISLIME